MSTRKSTSSSAARLLKVPSAKRANVCKRQRLLLRTASRFTRLRLALSTSKEALRDGLNGLGTPANWINTDEEIDAAQKAQQQAQQQQQLLGMMTQGAEAAAKIGQTSEALQGGGMLGG